MMFCNDMGTCFGLKVKQYPRQDVNHGTSIGCKLVFYSSTQQAMEHFIQPFALPPAFHVGFAQSQALLTPYPGIPSFILDLNIPGIRPIQGDTC
jgi:hypothetical protein